MRINRSFRSAQQSLADERQAALSEGLAAAAIAIQRAVDQHEIFEAVGAAIEMHGLSGHVATLDAAGQSIVIQTSMVPWLQQAQLERIHGGPMVGATTELAPGTAHWTVVHERRSMHAPEPMAWVITVGPEITPEESDAMIAFIGLGEALLVPITDERDAFGVLTVWALTLTRSHRAIAEILGRLAGGALAAQRARDVARPTDGRFEHDRPSTTMPKLAA